MEKVKKNHYQRTIRFVPYVLIAILITACCSHIPKLNTSNANSGPLGHLESIFANGINGLSFISNLLGLITVFYIIYWAITEYRSRAHDYPDEPVICILYDFYLSIIGTIALPFFINDKKNGSLNKAIFRLIVDFRWNKLTILLPVPNDLEGDARLQEFKKRIWEKIISLYKGCTFTIKEDVTIGNRQYFVYGGHLNN
ncbi:hypothetical protein OZX69_01440 [Lactobacillus sp. ESL0731]|uniref:hypothetical protein n=1 Tax=unclassified Lactobacillus TaxID=2620435 RepID=UPI0023F9029D|nr:MULTISPECIES: hypothetical protein [unclassified Lactobacillus]WEV51413.1 hypothetical protein OZX63_01440 [Lactobacillus sp. ESL0700]WEV62543.1 hypothetical protein OZX69_01440 [Lactobacillus sp. ESL0731]